MTLNRHLGATGRSPLLKNLSPPSIAALLGFLRKVILDPELDPEQSFDFRKPFLVRQKQDDVVF